jgi:hypothetical protein
VLAATDEAQTRRALTALLGAEHFFLPKGWLAPAAEPTTAPLSSTALRKVTNAWAQDQEDLEAYSRYFFGVRGGIILESGALDGVTFSTTKMFTVSLAWRAIHVEASPTEYVKLVESRPESLALNVALCNTSADVHFATGLDNFKAVSGMWEFMSDAFKQRAAARERACEQGVRGRETQPPPPPLPSGWWPQATPDKVAQFPIVPCRPLPPLLLALGITHVDFWVLDVEGAELEVVRSMDFSVIRVDVLVVELDRSSPVKDAACRALLDAAGYEIVGSWQGAVHTRSNWFVRRDFIPSEELHGERTGWFPHDRRQ